MKQEFIIRGHGDKLLLFFAGWGGDTNLFRYYRPAAGCDFLLCYDYRSLVFDATLLDDYREIRLVAWSMGVWAAAQVLAGLSLPFVERTAINGTPTPIDDDCGIPTAIFRGTLDMFSPVTLMKFRRRMCGSTDGVKAFLSHEPCRSLEELREELACIYRTVITCSYRPFTWNKAVIGSRDKIFPLQNQLAAWQGTPVQLLDEEHYSEEIFRKVLLGEGGGEADEEVYPPQANGVGR